MPNKRTLLFSILAIAAIIGFVSAQTGIAGVWMIHVPASDGTVQNNFLKLSQNGTAVTRTLIRNYRETEIKGSYTYGKLHLTVNPWRTQVLTYDGVLQDDHLEFT